MWPICAGMEMCMSASLVKIPPGAAVISTHKKKLGKCAVEIPRYVQVPFAHFSVRISPSTPVIFMSLRPPVIESNPVARAMTSSLW